MTQASPRTAVRPLRREELPEAATTLAAAFDDDPLFRYLLPEPRRRSAWLRWFHTTALRESYAVDGAATLAAGPRVGAIGFFPSGVWPLSLRRSLAALAFPRALPTLRLVKAGLHIERRIRVLHPPEPHVYIYVVGVLPSEKGRGHGGALLRHACASAREAGVVAHLETANPENLSLYRRFGFEVREEIVSHGGPPVWTMTTETMQ